MLVLLTISIIKLQDAGIVDYYSISIIKLQDAGIVDY